MSNTQAAIFLDRDGVINENPDFYVKSWEEFHFLHGTLDALKKMAELPWAIVIVSNQSAVGRGILSQEELDHIHSSMISEIEKYGGRIDKIMVCPHTPDAHCSCRKPEPGLLFQAADELKLNLRNSVMIGDSISDMIAALSAGVAPVLIPSNQIEAIKTASENESIYNQCASVRDLSKAADMLAASHGRNLTPRDMVYFSSNFDKDHSFGPPFERGRA